MLPHHNIYQNLFTDSKVPMLLICPDTGEILSANHAAALFYGYKQKRLTTFNINKINQLSAEEVKLEIARAKKLERNHFIFKHRLATGDIRDVEVYSSPVMYHKRKLLFSVIHDITDRIKAERQVNLYAQLFTASTDMLAVVSNEHIYLAANQAYLDMLAKTHAQVIGWHTRDVLGHPTYESHLSYFEQAISGKVVQFERRFINRNGNQMDTEIRYFPFFDNHGHQIGVVGAMRDITDKKLQEEQLKLSATVYQSTAEGIVISNKLGQIIDVNLAFTQLCGKNKMELIGKDFLDLFAITELPNTNCDMEIFNQDKTWRGEVKLKHINQPPLPVWATISPVNSEHQQHYVSIFRDITYYKKTSAQLEFLAHHDALTQLPNRALLNARLELCLQRAQRIKNKVYVLFIDLDRFKSINDSLGHKAGDTLLIKVAKRLKLSVRQHDTVARVSGDEFVVIIEAELTSFNIGQSLQRLIDAFSEPFELEGRSLFVTASIGVSQYPNDGVKTSELISNADAAMYTAKQKGRNQFSLFSEEQAFKLKQQTDIENALRGALQREEFELFFQPQIKLFNSDCLGLEVLLRWTHPELGEISPSVFIPMAEQLGLIWELGSWVLRKACEQGKRWHDNDIAFGQLAVNVAGMQLQHGQFYKEVAHVLTSTGFSPDKLELEITEDFVMNQAEDSIHQLDSIRQLGVDIAIDDFGTGYSSLSYLKQLPVNKLKIDRSFVNDLEKDSDSKVIISSIIALGQAMHLNVIAEGVESKIQAETLMDEGCEQAQGFLYGRPMSAGAAEQWLINNKPKH